MTTTITPPSFPATLVGTTWRIDPPASELEFRVRHFWGLVTVVGRFERFDGSLSVDESGDPAITLTVEAASLETHNARRDKRLRSEDFLDAERHPTVRFASTGVIWKADGKLEVNGFLEAAGKRIPLRFEATVRDGDGSLEVEGAAIADHRDLGMTWSPLGMLRAPATLVGKVRLTPEAAR
jgi:polyisoprenoid-binding protein YceI